MESKKINKKNQEKKKLTPKQLAKRKARRQKQRAKRKMIQAPVVEAKKKIPRAMALGGSAGQENRVSVATIVIPTELRSDALKIGMLSYISALFFKQQFRTTNLTDPEPVLNIYEGFAYLLEAIQTISQGTTMELTTLPQIWDIIISILKKKTVATSRYSAIEYKPEWSASPTLTVATALPNSSNFVLADYNNPNSGVPYAPNTVFTPSSADYSILLANVAQNTAAGKIVDIGTAKGSFCGDPSAYARVYTYFGQNGTSVGGAYMDAELEVPFYYPRFSKFVDYGNTDKVVARTFVPNTGHLGTIISELTFQGLPNAAIKNREPVIYKWIDFYQLYHTICGWLVAGFSGNIFSNGGPVVNPFLVAETLPFGAGDFMLALRQAVLSQFPEQSHGQFVAPISGAPTNSNSVFMPFICDSITTPVASQAGQMILPSFITENIAMLKQNYCHRATSPGTEKYGTESKSQYYGITPVWGVYSGDTPSIYNFVDVSGSQVPLFAPVNLYPYDNLWNCDSASNLNMRLNVNMIAAQVITAWNQKMEGYMQNKSTMLGPISTNSNNKVCLLPYTRVVSDFSSIPVSETRVPLIPTIQDQFLVNRKIERQQSTGKLKEKKIEKKIDAIPPSTYTSLTSTSYVSCLPIDDTIASALKVL